MDNKAECMSCCKGCYYNKSDHLLNNNENYNKRSRKIINLYEKKQEKN